MNFKRYNESDNSWVDSHYIKQTATDTITTLPAIIYPLAQTATIGLKGNTLQNGTPTPENPIMPQGTGDKTANLFDKNAKNTANGFIQNTMLQSDGTTLAWNVFSVSEYIPVEGGAEYYLSQVMSSAFNAPSLCFYDSSKQFISSVVYRARYSFAMTTPATAAYVRISYMNTQADVVMLNTGSTALPYEPFGVKIPISSANITTPVYLGEVQTTRRIKKFVLNGTESEDVLKMPSPNLFYYKVQNGLPLNSGACRCTHYINNQVPNVRLNNDEVKLDVTNVWGSTANVIVFKDTSKATLEDFKTWLQQQYTSGTPVTVWYTLGTSETSVINEPLMRIGDYADTVSNISIPVTAGGDTISVGTTVQPSEVTVNYKGWHPVADVHERENGQWD